MIYKINHLNFLNYSEQKSASATFNRIGAFELIVGYKYREDFILFFYQITKGRNRFQSQIITKMAIV
jgi:hypothetical protein